MNRNLDRNQFIVFARSLNLCLYAFAPPDPLSIFVTAGKDNDSMATGSCVMAVILPAARNDSCFVEIESRNEVEGGEDYIGNIKKRLKKFPSSLRRS